MREHTCHAQMGQGKHGVHGVYIRPGDAEAVHPGVHFYVHVHAEAHGGELARIFK